MDDIFIHDDNSFSKAHSPYADIVNALLGIPSSDEALVENDMNSLDALSDDLMENQDPTSSPPRMSSLLPSCEFVCSVETTNMVYPEPLLTIKG